jgi:hypothetical protein
MISSSLLLIFLGKARFLTAKYNFATLDLETGYPEAINTRL